MPRTEDEWANIARYVRHAVNKVGPEVLPLCLPGEPQQCGRSAREHALAWASELKAVAHYLIEESANSRDEAVYYAATCCKERLATMRQASPQSA
jgi:hypothetical protein